MFPRFPRVFESSQADNPVHLGERVILFLFLGTSKRKIHLSYAFQHTQGHCVDLLWWEDPQRDEKAHSCLVLDLAEVRMEAGGLQDTGSVWTQLNTQTSC